MFSWQSVDEAGRLRLKSSDFRPDAERRVDNVIVNAKTALTRSRRSTIILAFSLAASLLLGATAAWAGPALAAGIVTVLRFLSGMSHSNRWERRRVVA